MKRMQRMLGQLQLIFGVRDERFDVADPQNAVLHL